MSRRQSHSGSELLSPSVQKLRIEPSRRRAAAHDAAVAAVWFDYTDLIQYFGDNRMPTGIQRVQIELLRAAVQQPVAMLRPLGCAFIPSRAGWVVVPESLFAGICEAARDGSSDEAWAANIVTFAQALVRAPMAPFAPGDVLVNIGSSWWIPDYMTHVRYMQRERGLLYAPFLHDCIPIRAPEMCKAGLVAEFRAWFPQAVAAADLLLANSACTARDVAAVAREMTGRTVDAQIIRLDARFANPLAHLPDTARGRVLATVRARLGLNRPYALFVSTIEARKNHIFVFERWVALIKELGADAVPDLVCVGKHGWLVEYTTNWLAVHPELHGHIRIVGTLPDPDLAVLYGGALFSVYCSSYEGWGLPVTESLSHGRVPIVANHSSLPEAGGEFAVYFDPGSREQFRAAVLRVLDPVERDRLEDAIARGFRPREWPEVLAQLLATAREASLLEHDGTGAPALEFGSVYGFGRAALSNANGSADGATLRHGPGFWPAEDWGCWSNKATCELVFATGPQQGGRHWLYVLVRGGPEGTTLRVEVGGDTATTVALHATQRRLLRLAFPGDATETMVRLSAPMYSLATHTGGGDGRAIGFGLELLAVVAADDCAGRADVVEAFLAGG